MKAIDIGMIAAQVRPATSRASASQKSVGASAARAVVKAVSAVARVTVR
jgi:hypothetical protein